MSHSGHEEPWRAWRSALSGPRMHHGWLLAGKRGVGKFDFALAAARELVPWHPTLGDVDSPQALDDYQAAKRAHKAEWAKANARSPV